VGGAHQIADASGDPKERFKPDTTEANGSSIAFLAEYDGRSALFTGDAHAPVLETSIRTLLRNRGRDKLTVGAFKLPHHGSKYNVSPALLGLLDAASRGEHRREARDGRRSRGSG
jgi:beta-lactamase superfamily II metal-dependent hydrolase